VINIASLLAFSGSLPPRPLPFRTTYAAAKAYLVTFTCAPAATPWPAGTRRHQRWKTVPEHPPS
jgi:uncharacterized protein